MPTCRDCGRPVWWALSTHGKRTPIDPTPDPTGNLVIVKPDGSAVPVRLVGAVVRGAMAGGSPPTVTVARRGARSMDTDEPLPRWRVHWATCPEADKAAGRRKRGTTR